MQHPDLQQLLLIKHAHGLLDGRYITFSSVTVPSGSGYATTDFTDNTFEVLNKSS